MPLNRQKIFVVFWGVSFGLLFSLFCVFAKEIISNYATTDGFILANGREVASDFVAFFAAGRLVNEDINSLYNFEKQIEFEQNSFKNSSVKPGILPFVYPPIVALLFSGFAKGTLLKGYILWVLLSFSLGVGSMIALASYLRVGFFATLTFVFLLLGFEPFTLECLGSGQTSALGLAIFVLVFILIDKKSDFLAGLVLGFGYYKPPLFLFLSLALLVQKKFKLLAGAVLSGAVLLASSILMIGISGFKNYLSSISNYTYGAKLTHGVFLSTNKGVGLFSVLYYSSLGDLWLIRSCYLLIAFSALLLFCRRRNSKLQCSNNYFLITSFSLLLSSQMVVYDLSLLIPAIALYLNQFRFEKFKLIDIGIMFTIFGLYFEFLLREEFSSPFFPNPTSLLFLVWNLLLLLKFHHNQREINDV